MCIDALHLHSPPIDTLPNPSQDTRAQSRVVVTRRVGVPAQSDVTGGTAGRLPGRRKGERGGEADGASRYIGLVDTPGPMEALRDQSGEDRSVTEFESSSNDED